MSVQTNLASFAAKLDSSANVPLNGSAQGISGVLPIANGGTGATTTSAAISGLGILQAVYPVGSIYMNTSASTNPGTLLGFGTWSALAPGQMLLGNGSGYTAGNTGGTASIALSTANLPSHSHGASGLSASSSSSSTSSTSININDPGHHHSDIGYAFPYGSTSGPDAMQAYANSHNTSDAFTLITATASTTTSTSTSTTISGNTAAVGSGTSITTISPYLVVYMWQRTA